MNIQSNVKLLMEAKGFTVRGLAEVSGVSQRIIMHARDHRIESCSLATLAKIAEALEVGARDLFEERK